MFHLTDDQKALARDYAQNLSLFLGDGMFQYTEYGGVADPASYRRSEKLWGSVHHTE